MFILHMCASLVEGSGSPFLLTLTVQGCHSSGHLVDFFPSLQEFQSAVSSKDNGEASLLHVARDNAGHGMAQYGTPSRPTNSFNISSPLLKY